MNWYQSHILAPQIHRAMNKQVLIEDRIVATKDAHGVVLEIGFGSGLNLPYYTDRVTKLYALEPLTTLFEKAELLIKPSPFGIEYLPAPAESIPLPDNAIDYVISTWTLCSVSDPTRVLNEIARVLKPGGTFSFAEHGKSPHRFWGVVQEIASPFTALCDGNCHLNRNMEKLLIDSKLRVTTLTKTPEPSYPLDFGYSGIAQK